MNPHEPQAILATHLGLGDELPAELGEMVDAAFRANYDANRGRHTVAVTLNLRGSEVVQGSTYEGADVQVIAKATTEEGRTVTETLPLLELWRWPLAGLELVEVEPAVRAIAYYGLAETIDADGTIWSSIMMDQRGAPPS